MEEEVIEKAARAAAVERSRAHKRRKSINRERLAHWREHSNKDGRSRPPGVNRSPEWRESRSERNMVFRYEAMCASNSEDCFYRVCSVSRNRCRHRHSQCTFLSNDISGVSCIDPIDPTNITSSWMPVTFLGGGNLSRPPARARDPGGHPRQHAAAGPAARAAARVACMALRAL